MSVSIHSPAEIDPGFIRDQDDHLVDTLNITAVSIAQYNDSKVVCVAHVGSELSYTSAATLQGMYIINFTIILKLGTIRGRLNRSVELYTNTFR